MNTKEIEVKAEVMLPDVPLVLWIGDKPIPLCAVTEKAIQEIAVAWTADLLKVWNEQNENREDAYQMAQAIALEKQKYDLEDQEDTTAKNQIEEDRNETQSPA